VNGPDPEVVRIQLEDVPRCDMRSGGWSKMSLSQQRLSGNTACLGYASFPPGCVTQMLIHDAEELFLIVRGTGEIRLEDGSIPFGPLDAFFVPAGTWHAVANTGDIDVVTVFGFPTPDYPGTERRKRTGA
jgi:mannose-6-phosphate isomerase-like protein (cupin superfamily)